MWRLMCWILPKPNHISKSIHNLRHQPRLLQPSILYWPDTAAAELVDDDSSASLKYTPTRARRRNEKIHASLSILCSSFTQLGRLRSYLTSTSKSWPFIVWGLRTMTTKGVADVSYCVQCERNPWTCWMDSITLEVSGTCCTMSCTRGGYSVENWVGVCRWRNQTLTLFKRRNCKL